MYKNNAFPLLTLYFVLWSAYQNLDLDRYLRLFDLDPVLNTKIRIQVRDFLGLDSASNCTNSHITDSVYYYFPRLWGIHFSAFRNNKGQPEINLCVTMSLQLQRSRVLLGHQICYKCYCNTLDLSLPIQTYVKGHNNCYDKVDIPWTRHLFVRLRKLHGTAKCLRCPLCL